MSSRNLEEVTPQTLLQFDSYKVLIKLGGDALEESKAYIEKFPCLVDVDSCPEQFLPALGEQLGLTYDPTKELCAFRLALKIHQQILKKRGTARALKEFARLQFILNYAKDSDTGLAIVVPFKWTYVYDILYPATKIFTLSHSCCSSDHCFEDANYYRDGVIDIKASQAVLNILAPFIEYMRPAGVKIHWTAFVTSIGGESVDLIVDDVTYFDLFLSSETYFDICALSDFLTF